MQLFPDRQDSQRIGPEYLSSPLGLAPGKEKLMIKYLMKLKRLILSRLNYSRRNQYLKDVAHGPYHPIYDLY